MDKNSTCGSVWIKPWIKWHNQCLRNIYLAGKHLEIQCNSMKLWFSKGPHRLNASFVKRSEGVHGDFFSLCGNESLGLLCLGRSFAHIRLGQRETDDSPMVVQKRLLVFSLFLWALNSFWTSLENHRFSIFLSASQSLFIYEQRNWLVDEKINCWSINQPIHPSINQSISDEIQWNVIKDSLPSGACLMAAAAAYQASLTFALAAAPSCNHLVPKRCMLVSASRFGSLDIHLIDYFDRYFPNHFIRW